MPSAWSWFSQSLYKLFVCSYCCRGRHVTGGEDDKDGCSAGVEDIENSVSNFVEVHALRPDVNAKLGYPDNAIRTAKYSVLTCIPCSLFHQFHKVSNCFFVLVMSITLIPGSSPLNPFSAILPLSIVLTTGMIKDIWEDSKRQTADRRANAAVVHVLRYVKSGEGGVKDCTHSDVIPEKMMMRHRSGRCRKARQENSSNEQNNRDAVAGCGGEEDSDGEHDWAFVPVHSRDVHPGDLMLYRSGDEVKADCVILNSSLPSGLTYIDTSSLDGETNAKSRRAKLQTTDYLGTVEDIVDSAIYGRIHRDLAAAAAASPGFRAVLSHPEPSENRSSRSSSRSSNATYMLKTLFSRDGVQNSSSLSDITHTNTELAHKEHEDEFTSLSKRAFNVTAPPSMLAAHRSHDNTHRNGVEDIHPVAKVDEGEELRAADESMKRNSIRSDSSKLTPATVVSPMHSANQDGHPTHRIVSLYNTTEKDAEDDDEVRKSADSPSLENHTSHEAAIEARATATTMTTKEAVTGDLEKPNVSPHAAQPLPALRSCNHTWPHTSLAAALATPGHDPSAVTPSESLVDVLSYVSHKMKPHALFMSQNTLVLPDDQEGTVDEYKDSLWTRNHVNSKSYNNDTNMSPMNTARAQHSIYNYSSPTIRSQLQLSSHHTRDHSRITTTPTSQHLYHRHLTFDEFLESRGELPMPHAICELSQRYENAHSQANAHAMLKSIPCAQSRIQSSAVEETEMSSIRRAATRWSGAMSSRSNAHTFANSAQQATDAINDVNNSMMTAAAEVNNTEANRRTAAAATTAVANNKLRPSHTASHPHSHSHDERDYHDLAVTGLQAHRVAGHKPRQAQSQPMFSTADGGNTLPKILIAQESDDAENEPQQQKPNESAWPSYTTFSDTADRSAASPAHTGNNSGSYMEERDVVVLGSSPSADLSSWFGQLRMPHKTMTVSLGIDQFLPRGCVIRNTKWVLALALYTGSNTKVLLNMHSAPHKTNTMNRRLNYLNACFIIVSQFMAIFMCAMGVWYNNSMRNIHPGVNSSLLDDSRDGVRDASSESAPWQNATAPLKGAWYIQYDLVRFEGVALFFWRYLSNFILVSFFIPLSLYVTIEVNKAIQMYMIAQDTRLGVKDEKTGELIMSKPRTSELNSELGHVQYIFTDKTGTLTENCMTYVGGFVHGARHDERLRPGGVGMRLIERIQELQAATRAREHEQQQQQHVGQCRRRRRNCVVHGAKLQNSAAAGGSQDNKDRKDNNDGNVNNAMNLSHSTYPAKHHNAVAADDLAKANNMSPKFSPLGKVLNAGASLAATLGSHTAMISSTTLASISVPNSSMALPQSQPSPHKHHFDAYSSNLSSPGESVHQPNNINPGSNMAIASFSLGYRHSPLHSCNVNYHSSRRHHQHSQHSSPHRTGYEFNGSSFSFHTHDETRIENEPDFRYLRALALCHTIVCFDDPEYAANAREEKGKDKEREKELEDRSAPDARAEKMALVGKNPPQQRRMHAAAAALSSSRVGTVRSSTGRLEMLYSPRTLTPRLADNNEADSDHQQMYNHNVDSARSVSENSAIMDADTYNIHSERARVQHHGSRARSSDSCDRLDMSAPCHHRRSGEISSRRFGVHGEVADSNRTAAASASAVELPNWSSSHLYRHDREHPFYAKYRNSNGHTMNIKSSNCNDHDNISVNTDTSSDIAMSWEAKHEQLKQQFIMPGKIYEGQSLDEVALVSAASQNGFCLARRTTKQIFIRALGRAMCYDIIAELEFTPQRKLMSILLRRSQADDRLLDIEDDDALTHTSYHRTVTPVVQVNADIGNVRDNKNVNYNKDSSVVYNHASATDMDVATTSYGLMSEDDNYLSPTSSYWRDGQTASASAFAAATRKKEKRPYLLLVKGSDSSMMEILNESPVNASRAAAAAAALGLTVAPATTAAAAVGVASSPVYPLSLVAKSKESGILQRSLLHKSASLIDASPSSEMYSMRSLPHDRSNSPASNIHSINHARIMSTAIYRGIHTMNGVSTKEKAIAAGKNTNRSTEAMMRDLDEMASLGLRTLVLGQRYLTEAEVRAWLPVYQEAQCSMKQRSEKLHAAYALLEHSIDCVGSTAVEDQLQAGVPETLDFFLRASIVVWMLTGDKRETAVTIAQTSGLVSARFARYVCHLDACNPHANHHTEAATPAAPVSSATVVAGSPSAHTDAAGVIHKRRELEQNVRQNQSQEQRQSLNRLHTLHRSPGPSSASRMSHGLSHAVVDSAGLPMAAPTEILTDSGSTLLEPIESFHTHAPTSHAVALSRSMRRESGYNYNNDNNNYRHDRVIHASNDKNDNITTATTTINSSNAMHLAIDECECMDEAQCNATLDAQFDYAEAMCREGLAQYVVKTVMLVVDGKTLDRIFADDQRARRFFDLSCSARCGVCCRMTPMQKAQVVRMFQHNLKATTLAIGDGANDVSMIQESKIGVAIMGLEGSQAELASDYALPKFRCLKRLLMVHGRFSIYREAHCILYSLYKNVILVVGLAGYSFFTAFSGLSFFDSWMLSLYSVTFCVLQPITLGTLNKDCEDELAESVPQLYPPLSHEMMYFSVRYIAKWLSDGLVEGVLIFLALLFLVASEDDLFSFRSAGVVDYGFTYFTLLIFVSNLRSGVTHTYGCVVLIVTFFVEMAILPSVQFLYSSVPFLLGSNDMVYVAESVYGSSSVFWMLLFLAFVIFMLYTMSTNVYIQLFAPWENAAAATRAGRVSSYRHLYKRPRARHLSR